MTKKGKIGDRSVTIVYVPGWEDFPSKYAPRALEREIILSQYIEPHVFFITIRVDTSFQDFSLRHLTSFLHLLGKRFFYHAMVLFTYADWLGGTNIEYYIEGEGESLHSLIEKCGGRYHALCNKGWNDPIQVTELFEKIEDMVVANNGHHFKMDHKIVQELRNRKGTVKKNAEKMIQQVKRQEKSIWSETGMFFPLSLFKVKGKINKCTLGLTSKEFWSP